MDGSTVRPLALSPNPELVCLVADDAKLRGTLSRAFTGGGFSVQERRFAALDALDAGCHDVIACELAAGSAAPFNLIASLRRAGLDLPVILFSREDRPGLGIDALERGATDFVGGAFDPRELVLRAGMHLKQAARLRALSELAHIDELTGVFNRRGLMMQLQKTIARAEREGTTFSLLLIDLDGFKTINDLRGHAAGDAILKAVARALTAAVRQEDLVARLGGDEFVVLLPGTHRILARQVVRRIEASLPVPASIGIATPEGSQLDAARLLAKADRLMYLAKRRRKSDRAQLASV